MPADAVKALQARDEDEKNHIKPVSPQETLSRQPASIFSHMWIPSYKQILYLFLQIS